MSPLDATFLYVEDGVTHMHIASCAVFEGPAPTYDRVRRTFGGTVNDVIVAVVTSGLRQLLLARDEPIDELTVRSLIPVSIRSDEAHNLYENRVTAMFDELPVAIGDPIERLDAVREQMGMLKSSHQAHAGIGLTA